jgi:hypothetical protein
LTKAISPALRSPWLCPLRPINYQYAGLHARPPTPVLRPPSGQGGLKWSLGRRGVSATRLGEGAQCDSLHAAAGSIIKRHSLSASRQPWPSTARVCAARSGSIDGAVERWSSLGRSLGWCRCGRRSHATGMAMADIWKRAKLQSSSSPCALKVYLHHHPSAATQYTTVQSSTPPVAPSRLPTPANHTSHGRVPGPIAPSATPSPRLPSFTAPSRPRHKPRAPVVPSETPV